MFKFALSDKNGSRSCKSRDETDFDLKEWLLRLNKERIQMQCKSSVRAKVTISVRVSKENYDMRMIKFY